METSQPSLFDEVPRELKPYVKAMQKASGLSEFEAITSVLYAVTTHLDLEEYPILAYLGVAGSGKSSAMKQLFPMCSGSTWIGGRTVASQRRELRGVRTAFVEEADSIDTELYIWRYAKQTGVVEVTERVSGGRWKLQPYNIFGATVLHRRVSIGDVGLRSRCIVIRTEYKLGSYEITAIREDLSGLASGIAEKLRRGQIEVGELDRVWQSWRPLFMIGKELGMTDWYKKAFEVTVKEAETLAGGRGYEPSEAILHAIDIQSRDINGKRVDKSIRISEVVRVVKEEFALILKPPQIREEAEARGFEAGRTAGYPTIKVKKELLDTLLPE